MPVSEFRGLIGGQYDEYAETINSSASLAGSLCSHHSYTPHE